MSDTVRSTEVAEAPAPAAPIATRRPRTYPYKQPVTWWLRNRRYVLYMLRELSPVPMGIWLLIFLFEVLRLHDGAKGFQPFGGPVFVIVSLICLAAALWHSFTFLNLAGLIMRIPMPLKEDAWVPPRVIVGGAFAGFVVVTVVIAALLIGGGQ
jgi:fumarate reductase subunit C